ncbi:MAG: poly-gamma-glutamate biosynthesis protein PgsC/CapC [Mariprofundus sp.]|nr:poly-gamma-glutamate biosynthesis protein PgsC/CapC [Mariprofundus sp.]
MLDIFPLAIFPETSLASSVVTTVWVGVFVVAFFNLRLGWVLSGLVMPGYVVPLLISKPWAAAVLLLEGVMTYWIVWLFSEYFSKHGPWSNLFGRDRFFALFLVSVAVRIVMDGWLLPVAGASFNEWLNINFDYRNNLHSFGLIIVALMANQFWKTGLLRGIVPMFVTLGVTYLIVRYGLMELTNFSISGINYLYEDIAASMLASPKAYIILIVTALIASRMNMHYGWDFNGILIPALLALQWYQPTKILISFAEAFLIYGLAIWLLRAPFLQQISIEGGRKLLLFFNVGFAYKMLLGYVLLWFFPEYKPTDFFAFGYLLSTLIAIKMHDKGIAARLTRATLQTSLVAVVVASMVGYALTFLPDLWSWPVPPAAANARAQYVNPDERLINLVRDDKIAIYNSSLSSVNLPLPQELDEFAQGLKQLLAYTKNHDEVQLREAIMHLERVNYSVTKTRTGLLYLREKEPRNGWGIYVIRMQPKNKLAIEVPDPLGEQGTAEAGVAIFELSEARALAIGGSRRRANADGSADVLRNYQTTFNVFHRELGMQDALQLRAFKEQEAADLAPQPAPTMAPERLLRSGLWVKRELPEGVNLQQVKALIGALPIVWGVSPVEGIQRTMSQGHFAELVLDRDGMRSVQALLLSEQNLQLRESKQTVAGYLLAWMRSSQKPIAMSGSNLYQKPSAAELRYVDEELLTPLLRLIKERRQLTTWSADALIDLRLLDAAAATLGYQLIRYHQQGSHEESLILEEREAGERHYWGRYIFSVGHAASVILQIPRPLFEANSFEAGIALFASLHPQALLIAGAEPDANSDHTADVLSIQQGASIFNLVSQVIQREALEEPMLGLQVRAFGLNPDRPASTSAALMAFDNGARSEAMLSPLAKSVSEQIRSSGVDFSFVNGTAATAGYEVSSLAQAQYLQQSRNKELALLWLSPMTRSGFRQQSDNISQLQKFNALGIITHEGSLYQQVAHATHSDRLNKLPKALGADLRRFLAQQDAVTLYRAHTAYPAYRLERLLDSDSQRAFLLLYQKQGNRLALVVDLAAQDLNRSIVLSSYDDQAGVAGYLKSGAAWLTFGGGL